MFFVTCYTFVKLESKCSYYYQYYCEHIAGTFKKIDENHNKLTKEYVKTIKILVRKTVCSILRAKLSQDPTNIHQGLPFIPMLVCQCLSIFCITSFRVLKNYTKNFF